MNTGLRLTLLWYDSDILELRAFATNGVFAASTEFYDSRDVLANLASAISGFPSAPADTRDFLLGSMAPGFAGGGLRLSLNCASSGGTPKMTLNFRSKSADLPDGSHSFAAFSLFFEPAQLDRFVRALYSAPLIVGTKVQLADPGEELLWGIDTESA